MWPFSRKERRASPEDPRYALSDPSIVAVLFGDSFASEAGVEVTADKALGVPAVWAATGFISATIASLPLEVFRRNETGEEKLEDELAVLLGEAANDELTSFEWRQSAMDNTLIGGRSYTFIERNAGRKPMNLWPLDPTRTRVERKDGKKLYIYREGRRNVTYAAAEVIDIPWRLASDGLTHVRPIDRLKNAIGLAIALEAYASKFFQNGGVPPLQLVGPFQSPAGAKRASDDILAALREARAQGKPVLPLPTGHELKQIGFDPAKGQMTEAQRFQLEQIARIYQIPPVFLQDLTHGTFSNTEQQDLHVVKHTLRQWLKRWEQELNLKLFGRGKRDLFVKFNVDGLLRGDFKTRMEGLARAVQNAILKPNEARALEHRAPAEGGDQLMIQGATVPIGFKVTG